MPTSLNPAQKQAVEYTSSPLLIVAGAGTGKTTVITQKIIRLIENKLTKPEEILALTFTDKAAAEMRDRVDKMINTGYADMQISTFHAFCQKILERHALDIGLPNQFKLLTQTDAWLLVRRNLDKFNLDYYRPLGNPARHIHELIKHFSKCKDELIAPEEYLEYAQNIKLDKDSSPETQGDINAEIKRAEEVANAYHAYNQLLLENNALDFGDLIFYALKLLNERSNILRALQNRFKYILVDEFQDVNWAQYQLTRLCAGKTAQLTVVGDDDQSIYAFRGASVSNILRFKEDYPAAKEVVLTQNYRSGQEILDLAYQSIQNNNPDRLEVKLKIDKKLISCHSGAKPKNIDPSLTLRMTKTLQNDKINTQKDSVVHIHSANIDEEVNAVVKEITRLKETDADATYDDFAILVRANLHADPFINALEKAGVPYEFTASAGLYRQPIVLDCVNFLKLTDNHHESAALYRLLCLPFLKFSEFDLHKITGFANKKKISIYEALKQSAVLSLSKEGLAIAEKIITLVHEGMRRARNEKPTVLLYDFLEKSGYLQYLTSEEGQGNRAVIRQIYQLQQFFEYIAAFETENPGATVAGFMEHLNYVLESGEKGALFEPKETPDSVNLMTIHTAKGLEFKYVFMVNLVEDRFPSRDRGEAIEIPAALIKEQLPEGDEHTQEERRLFYVAMTRAKKRLYFTSADNYGGSRAKKLSRFLDELGYKTTSGAAGCRPEQSEGSLSKKLTTAIDPSLANGRAQDDKLNDKKGPKGEFVFELPAKYSFSQIKAYETCPYQYKLSNILHIPTKGSAAFSFGQSMHATLQAFYARVQELNRAEQGTLFGASITPAKTTGEVKAPDLKELLALYETKWQDDWYESARQREEYFAKGKDILKNFYDTHAAAGWTVPVSLEGWFQIKLGDHVVHGRIDRVDQLPDGTLEIVDYKTGKAKEKVTGEDKEQLLIYQIAAEQLPEYRTLGPTSRLTFYYLNENIKVSFLGTTKEIEKIQEKIIAIIDKIQTREFKATPSAHTCARCDFRDICEFRA